VLAALVAVVVVVLAALAAAVGVCVAIALYETLNQPDVGAVHLTAGGVVGALHCAVVEVAAIVGIALLRLSVRARTWTAAPSAPAPGPALPPVVLVHGWKTSGAAWAIVAHRLRRAGWPRLIAIDHTAAGGFDGAVATLRDRLDGLRREHGASSVLLVGHGLGGIVCRLYLRTASPPVAVRKLVTLATPHQGSKLYALAGTSLPAELRDGAPLVAELTEPAAGEIGVDTTAIAASFDPFVVPAGRAHLPGASNITIENVGHFGMLWSARVVALVDENLRHELDG